MTLPGHSVSQRDTATARKRKSTPRAWPSRREVSTAHVADTSESESSKEDTGPKLLSQHLSMKINEVGTLNFQGMPGGQENLGIQQTLDQVCLVQECPEQHKTRTDPRAKLSL